MTRPHVPQEILDAAHARKAARAARDWAEADRLKVVIDAAGWRVVDRGADFALSPVHAPDVRDGDRIRYGSSAGVPSRLAEAAANAASVVVRATDDGAAVERAVAAVRAHCPHGSQVVVVGDGPGPDAAASLARLEALGGPDLEVIWTAERLGPGAAINIGLRRATGNVVIMLDPVMEPGGDIVTPLVSALADPGIALAGAGGLGGTDVRDLAEVPAGDVAALDGTCLAVRRADAAAREPIDERFRVPRLLATWWSLVLRDEGEERPPRRALALDNLPLISHGAPAEEMAPAGWERLTRRDRYRLLDRFAHRPDLVGERGPA